MPGRIAGTGPTARAEPITGFERFAGWGLAVAVIVFYNTWTLAFLSPYTDPLAGYISELAADNQPAAWVFRGGDLISGMLMVLIACRTLSGSRVQVRDWRWVVAAGTALTGIGTIADVIWNMPCSPSFDDACRAAADSGALEPEFLAHTITSSVVTVAVCASMIAAAIPSRGPRRWVPVILTVLIVLSSAVSGAIEELMRSGQGYVQISQILIVSGWIGWLAVDVHRPLMIERVLSDAEALADGR